MGSQSLIMPIGGDTVVGGIGMVKSNGSFLLVATPGVDYQFPKVTYDNVYATFSDWAAVNYDGTNYTQGNTVIINMASETWIHNGGHAGTTADFYMIEAIGGGGSGVSSFNTRTGSVTLISADVTTALTFTPYNATNPSGYINSITGITAGGDLTGTYPNPTIANTIITGKLLTGYVSGAGIVAATDSILQAIEKLNGNIGALTTGVSSVFGRSGIVVATSGDYNTSQVTEMTNLYFTNARGIGSTLTGYISGIGTISAADSILSAIQKLNGNITALVAGVSSVSNSDGTLTISPTSGSVIASLALGHANIWTSAQTFSQSNFLLKDDTTHTISLSAPNSTSTYFLILPAGQGSLNQAMVNDGSGNLSWNTMSSVVAEGNLLAQTAAVSTVTSYTSVATGSPSTYRVGGYVTITAVSLDVIQLQVTYTDETSTSRTQTFFPQGLTSANLATVGAFTFPTMHIRVQSASLITVKTVLTTGTGSITYDVGATIEAI